MSEWTFTGTLEDGRRVEVTGCDLFTFRDSKIAVRRGRGFEYYPNVHIPPDEPPPVQPATTSSSWNGTWSTSWSPRKRSAREQETSANNRSVRL